MTRDEALAIARDLGVEGNPDGIYRLVALAIKRERENCLKDIEIERGCWTRGRNDMGVMVCDYISTAIKKRGMQ